MKEQRADRVGLGVQEIVEVGLRHALDVVRHLFAREGEHGNQGADLRRVPRPRSDDPRFLVRGCGRLRKQRETGNTSDEAGARGNRGTKFQEVAAIWQAFGRKHTSSNW
jgi:hypothetical protein